MMPRSARWSFAALLIAVTSLFAQETQHAPETQQRCNSSARECEQEIRKMLSGRRYFGAQIFDQKPGIIVKAINADGPAAQAELKPGDRIIAVNGRQMTMAGVKEFKQALADAKDTGKIFMIIQRRGAYRKVELRLEPYPKAQVDKIIAAHLAQSHPGSVAASQP
jgi:predicted metalloprotease with PDZ domain